MCLLNVIPTNLLCMSWFKVCFTVEICLFIAFMNHLQSIFFSTCLERLTWWPEIQNRASVDIPDPIADKIFESMYNQSDAKLPPVWKMEPSGEFSVQMIYHFFHSISRIWKYFLTFYWRCCCIVLAKNFKVRLRWLNTAMRCSVFIPLIQQHRL